MAVNSNRLVIRQAVLPQFPMGKRALGDGICGRGIFPAIFPPILFIIESWADRDMSLLHHIPHIRRDQPTNIHFDFVCTSARGVMMAVARLYLAPNAILRFRQWRQLHMIPLAIDAAQFIIFAKRDMLNRWGLAVEPGAATSLFFRQPIRAAE